MPERASYFLTKKDVAKELSISISTLDRWVRAGLFPVPVKINGAQGQSRWSRTTIECFIREISS